MAQWIFKIAPVQFFQHHCVESLNKSWSIGTLRRRYHFTSRYKQHNCNILASSILTMRLLLAIFCALARNCGAHTRDMDDVHTDRMWEVGQICREERFSSSDPRALQIWKAGESSKGYIMCHVSGSTKLYKIVWFCIIGCSAIWFTERLRVYAVRGSLGYHLYKVAPTWETYEPLLDAIAPTY